VPARPLQAHGPPAQACTPCDGAQGRHKNPYYQQRDMLVTVSQFKGLGGWESKNPDCCRVSPIRNPTIYESFESPHPLRLYTQRLERSRLPLGLLCFGNCWWQVASANPSAPRASHSSHRMHHAPASSIASHRDRPDQNNRIVKEIARSFIDCTTAVYRYRLRRIFKKGTPGTIVITRRLMLI